MLHFAITRHAPGRSDMWRGVFSMWEQQLTKLAKDKNGEIRGRASEALLLLHGGGATDDSAAAADSLPSPRSLCLHPVGESLRNFFANVRGTF